MPPFISTDLDARFFTACSAEFIGTLLFQFLGALGGTYWSNGLALAVTVYATAPLSGGHLNPAISIAMAVSGHMHWLKSLLYIVSQILGAVVGALLEAALVPGLTWAWFGHHNKETAPGCFYPGAGVNNYELLAWELVLTFVLVYIVYAVAVAAPGQGNMGPLVIGLALFVSAEAGAQYTGGALNPARVIGPSLVFLCTPQKSFWAYLIGEVLGGILAAGACTATFGSAFSTSHLDGNPNEDPLLGGEGTTV